MLGKAPGDVGEWSEVNLNALVAHHSRWSDERWVFWCVWVGALQKHEKRRIECVGEERGGELKSEKKCGGANEEKKDVLQMKSSRSCSA